MELVDMNSLGLFDFLILSVQVGFTLNISYCIIYHIYVYKYVISLLYTYIYVVD